MFPTLSRLTLAIALAMPLSVSAFESIESDRLAQPEPGTSGGIRGSIDGRSGNTERENYTVGGRLHYQAGDTGMFVVTEHSRGKAGNLEIENNTWVHAHYRDEFQRGLAAEAFVDHLNDDFRQLDARTQLGAGVRFTLDYTENQRGVYAGIGLLHEWEEQAGADDHYWRINSYISYKRQLNPQARVVFNLYWQPSLDSSSDHLIVVEPAFVVELAKQLELKVGVKLEHDSATPTGVKEDETRYVTSLSYQF
ncbi:MAG: DUF481 domain-containing protein [Moraxellaceae bacterium]|nr:DUF481 domain-containing protein [Moraxellaceae bacterium]